VCRHIVSVQTMERYLGCKHRFRLAVNDHSVLDRSEIMMSGEEDRLRHYLWFSFSCAGAVAVQAKLKTIANPKVIRMKHQIGLTGISFNPHHFIFKKEGRF
jgi:hypothetical protein